MKPLFPLILITVFTVSHATASGNSALSKLLIKKVVVSYKDTTKMNFVKDENLRAEKWDSLAQPQFWQKVMRLSADSCLINVANCRTPLEVVSMRDWQCRNEDEKTGYKTNLCRINNFDETANIYVTSGKREFYELRKTLPDISKAVNIFISNNTDPWYAQAIILIESPGKFNAKSSVGANGPFQLMKGVALKYGLTVNKYRDDRTDLVKSANAAAKFINAVCVAKVKESLNGQGIAYNEHDLWFRLLVLHAYHAGAGNIAGVIRTIGYREGGVGYIQKVWQTEYGSFKNQSQNYSQIALASMLSFDSYINKESDSVFLVQGNLMHRKYKNQKHEPLAAVNKIQEILHEYENDLAEGVIPFDYYSAKMKQLVKEMNVLAEKHKNDIPYLAYKYPANEIQLLHIANILINKRQHDVALKLLHINLTSYPTSISTLASLGRAYKSTGNKQMAERYTNLFLALSQEQNKDSD